MQKTAAMSASPILYQNADKSVTLIDIPVSIAEAQGVECRLLSSTARDEPFPSTEPRSPAARARVLALMKSNVSDAIHCDLIREALQEIQLEHTGSWCKSRFVLDAGFDDGKSRKPMEDQISECLGSISRASRRGKTQVVVSDSENANVLSNWDGSYFNDSGTSQTLRIASAAVADADAVSERDAFEDLHFDIPLQASFLLSDCWAADKFRDHVRWVSQERDNSRKFDLILMDPPWENRSAKRSASYETSSVQAMMENMDLPSYLQPNGYVGIWVTNKTAHRELVLGEGGIFQHLNVTLVEEWVWIKTTTKGEPVTQLDGIWRKPFEVLLLGQAPDSRLQIARPADKIARRVIAAVPDFHSRKPCLKTLIEPYLPIDPQVLEIFARYLVTGWTSWGNEVLKYNCKCFHEQEMNDGEGIRVSC